MYNHSAYKEFCNRSLRDNRGTIAVIWALVFTVVLVTIGGAIDFRRWHLAKQMTSEAIDAAVLAGGLALQLNPQDAAAAKDTARKTYEANIANRAPVMADNVVFTVDPSSQAINATGSAKLATTVLSVFGMSELGLVTDSGVRAEVTTGGPGGSNLEVVAMLDVTGSMCDDQTGPCTSGVKINALKAATTRLVDIVVRPDQSVTTTKVGFVPFSTRVRLAPDGGGAALMKSVTNLDNNSNFWYTNCLAGSGGGGSETDIPWSCTSSITAQATNWQTMPCVTERYSANAFEVSDDAPGPGKWINAHDGGRMPLSWDSSDTVPSSGTGASAGDLYNSWNYSPNPGDCADISAGSEIVPLTSDKANLINHIGTLQAFGGTAGALATSWTWYMLSPNWAAVWTGAGGYAPAPYSDLTAHNGNGAPKLRKIVVIETDGAFNVFRGSKGQDQQTVSDYAISVCNAMKAKGIEIYTVGFMLNSLTPSEATIARATLQACGTDVQHFYDSLNAGDLKTAFNNIGVKLSGLRLMK